MRDFDEILRDGFDLLEQEDVPDPPDVDWDWFQLLIPGEESSVSVQALLDVVADPYPWLDGVLAKDEKKFLTLCQEFC